MARRRSSQWGHADANSFKECFPRRSTRGPTAPLSSPPLHQHTHCVSIFFPPCTQLPCRIIGTSTRNVCAPVSAGDVCSVLATRQTVDVHRFSRVPFVFGLTSAALVTGHFCDAEARAHGNGGEIKDWQSRTGSLTFERRKLLMLIFHFSSPHPLHFRLCAVPAKKV